MTNRGKNWLLAGTAAAALLEFIIIIALLLPAHRMQPGDVPAAANPVRTERRLAAAMPLGAAQPEKAAKTDAAKSGAQTAAAEEPSEEEPAEPQEKETPEDEQSAAEIIAGTQVIAHAMGAIDGLRTPNCLEGFLAQYEAGVRVFEVDLRLTRDCKVVLRHDWWDAAWQEGIDWVHIPTREQFLSEKILGRYTPLSFQDLLLLMEEYPDVCVITDTKFTESDVFTIQFDAMLEDARELGLTYLFDRIFIQVYSGNMRTALHNMYPFPHYIYTLYQDPDAPFKGTVEDFRARAAYCRERGIEGITMYDSLWKPEFAAIAAEYGVRVYVHTVNDPEAAAALLDAGVDAVYSDSLTPGDLAKR